MCSILKQFRVTYNTDRFGEVDMYVNAVDAKEAAQIVRQEPYFLGILAIREEVKGEANVDSDEKPR